MSRTVYPADSSSQMSTNRGSLLGRQQGLQGSGNRNGIQGSMLGRASYIGHDSYAADSRFPIQRPHHLPRRGKSSINIGLDDDLKLTRLADLRDNDQALVPRGSIRAVGNSVSERNVNQLSRNLQATHINPGVNIDIHNANREAPRSLSHRSQGFPQPTQYITAPPDDYTMQKRFIVMTARNMPVRLGNLMCSIFQVQPGKVNDWLREGLIRIDAQKWKNGVFPYDIEPLTAQLTAKDIEKWDQFVRGYDSDRELQNAIGPGEASYVDFERDFGGGRSSRGVRGPDWESRYRRYDPRCRTCAFQRAYCRGVDVFHFLTVNGPRRW